MKNGKLLVVLISVAFFLALIFSFYIIFSVNKVQVEFDTPENVEVENLNKEFDAISSKLIFFVKEKEIDEIINEYSYFERTSEVLKVYPNVIKFSVAYRSEKFVLSNNEKNYILDKNGVVLTERQENNEDLLKLNITGFSITNLNCGTVASVDKQELFNLSLDIINSCSIQDITQNITVDCSTQKNDIIINTNQGVQIEVQEFNILGKEKISKVLNDYNELDDTYIKTVNKIIVYCDANGEIQVVMNAK